GEIDAVIRETAYENDATLITADRVQAEAAKATGVTVLFVPLKKSGKLKLESFFDDKTMSVHLKSDVFAFGKKGAPGSWALTPVSDKPLSSSDVEFIAKEILEKSRGDPNAFI